MGIYPKNLKIFKKKFT